MIRSLILKRLGSEERALGVSLDYVRYILRTSLSSFLKFSLFMPLSKNRRSLPASPYSVGRIVATRDEDCGTCVQIEVNLAKKAGVPIAVLQAVSCQKPDWKPWHIASLFGAPWFATNTVQRHLSSSTNTRPPVSMCLPGSRGILS